MQDFLEQTRRAVANVELELHMIEIGMVKPNRKDRPISVEEAKADLGRRIAIGRAILENYR